MQKQCFKSFSKEADETKRNIDLIVQKQVSNTFSIVKEPVKKKHQLKRCRNKVSVIFF